MKKTSNFDRLIRVHLSLALMLILKSNTTAQQLSQDPLYELVFHDEFDSLGLDTSKWLWRFEYGHNVFNDNKIKGCDDPNTPVVGDSMDLAYNSDNWDNSNNVLNDTTGSGFRRLISKKEASPVLGEIWNYNPWSISYKPFNYTTSMLKSRNFFRYGYFEIRFKTDNYTSNNNAYGPNFWLLGGDTSYDPNFIAKYSEIDVFEMNSNPWYWRPNTLYRHNAPNDTTATNLPYDTTKIVAYNYSGTGPYPTNNYYGINVGNWNVAGCEWTKDYVDFYYNSSDTIRRYSDEKVHVGDFTHMSVIVDNYTPATQYCLYVRPLTPLPFNYDIDYVRVYQIKQDCVPKALLTTNSSIYQNKLYQNLSIGGIGGNALFNSGISHLSAQDYVILDEGFEAGGASTTVIIDTRKCLNGPNITHPNFQLATQPFDEFFIKDVKSSKIASQ